MMVNDPRYSDAVTANAVVDNRHITSYSEHSVQYRILKFLVRTLLYHAMYVGRKDSTPVQASTYRSTYLRTYCTTAEHIRQLWRD